MAKTVVPNAFLLLVLFSVFFGKADKIRHRNKKETDPIGVPNSVF